MPETRTRRIIVYLEDTLYDLVEKSQANRESALSAYVRELVVRDLAKSGLLTGTMMLDMLASPNGLPVVTTG